jgi:hypothetical protein
MAGRHRAGRIDAAVSETMAKIKPATGKKGKKGKAKSAKEAIPCLLILLLLFVGVMLLFYLVLKSA